MKRKIAILIILSFLLSTSSFIVAYSRQDSDLLSNKTNPQVVIYNSLAIGTTGSGEKISQFTERLDKYLNMENEISKFLIHENKSLIDAYKETRELVKGLKNYNSKILIDIHGYGVKDIHLNNDIVIHIGKSNKSYEKNLAFAKSLKDKIENADNSLKCAISIEENARFNQDLSEKAVLIVIGNKNTTKSKEINIVNALTVSIQNLIDN